MQIMLDNNRAKRDKNSSERIAIYVANIEC